MKCQIVEEWTHITQNLLDDEGNEVKGKNGEIICVDDYDIDFPEFTVQDAETGENLETFTHFGDALAYKKKLETPRKWAVIEDRQGGEFGMYRVLTAKEWLDQAMEWLEQDGNEEIEDILKRSETWTEQEIIDYIGDLWELTMAEVVEVDGAKIAFTSEAVKKEHVDQIYRWYVRVYEVNDTDLEQPPLRALWDDYYTDNVDLAEAVKELVHEQIEEHIIEIKTRDEIDLKKGLKPLDKTE